MVANLLLIKFQQMYVSIAQANQLTDMPHT